MINSDFAVRLNKPIETQRLQLEPLLAVHADDLFIPLCDHKLYRWIESGGPKDLEQLRAKWKRNESRMSPDGKEAWLNWAIRLRGEGPYIGKLDAELDAPSNVINVGFILFSKYWGLGYATEALMSVKTALSSNGVLSMRATVATPNVASAGVLIKCGFTRGDLVTDEVDTHEWKSTIPRHRNEKAQQGDAPKPAST